MAPKEPDRPAGTYARQVLQQLLVDLSWASSHMEGNTYSLPDTERLIAFGEVAEGKALLETQMILNHKFASEFQLPYLPPFLDGNKRTARLAANIPFIRMNCIPITFMDVAPEAFTDGMISVFETNRIRFQAVVETELASLHEGNFARYQLHPSQFAAWRGAGSKPETQK